MHRQSETLLSGQFLVDLQLAFPKSEKLIHINSATGTGKSTLVMESLSQTRRIIFAVPQRVQVTQLRSKYGARSDTQFFVGGHTSGTPSEPLIVCTYDQLPAILAHVNSQHYTLVIDEVHKLYQAAAYREQAVSYLLDAISGDMFEQVITLSATVTRRLLPFQHDSWIDVRQSDAVARKIHIRTYDKPKRLKETVQALSPSQPGGCLVIRVNDKQQLAHFKKGFELRGLRCLAISRDLQATDEVQSMLEAEHIADGYGVVLTTSLTDEAININNTNICSLHIYGGGMHTEELKQFIGRFRKQNPPVVMHLGSGSLQRTYVDLGRRKQQLIATAETALALHQNLTELECSVTAESINTTIRTLGGRFSPLKDEPLIMNQPHRVQVNQASIIAELYRQDTVNQYSSEQLLINRIENQFGTSVTVTTEKIQEPASATYDSTKSKVDAALISERNSLFETCRQEAESEAAGSSLQEAVSFLRTHYDEDTPAGKLYSDWDALNHVVLFDPKESFDVLLHERGNAVWSYWKAANNDALLQPLLIRLSEFNPGTRLTNDQAKQIFLECYRQTCKKNPTFKDLIRDVGGSRVWVKANNHLDVSTHYLRKVFRHYTNSRLERRYIEFQGIQPFGYRYRLHDLNSALVKQGKSPLYEECSTRARASHLASVSMECDLDIPL